MEEGWEMDLKERLRLFRKVNEILAKRRREELTVEDDRTSTPSAT